jgi:plastocyanin
VTTLSLLAITGMGCAESHSAGDVSRDAAVGTMPDAGGDGGATSVATKAADDPERREVERQIKIDNFTFDPPTLTIAVGTKVTWVNRDDVPHTATSTAKPRSFNSGTLDTDQQFSHVFTKPGSYEYFCAVHPKMTGRIVVK